VVAAPPPHADVRPGTGCRAAHDPRQVARALDLAAIEADDDVADLDTGLLGGTARLDAAHQRPLGARQPQRLRDILGHLGDDHADAAAHDPAGLLDLLGDVHRLVDRDRERDAHEAARAAVDLGVDAHDLALHVDQGAPGVAGVHRYVGLDEGQVLAGIAALGR